jgi:hypothetical protein
VALKSGQRLLETVQRNAWLQVEATQHMEHGKNPAVISEDLHGVAEDRVIETILVRFRHFQYLYDLVKMYSLRSLDGNALHFISRVEQQGA